MHPDTPPSVGTEPVGSDARYDWTSGTISKPSDPAQNLDAAVERAGDDMDGDEDKGRSASWTPTNIVAGKKASKDPDSDEDQKLGLAEALDRTIVKLYQMAKGNEELRKGLAVAWNQFNALRGHAAPKNTDISRKMAELKQEIGEPDTGTVSGHMKYLRSMGSAPIGYGGLLDHDPDLHMVSAAERMARDKLDLARSAEQESTVAEARVKAARREAELNDVIRRRMRG